MLSFLSVLLVVVLKVSSSSSSFTFGRSRTNGTTVAPLSPDLKLILPLIFIPFVFAYVNAIVSRVLFTRSIPPSISFGN